MATWDNRRCLRASTRPSARSGALVFVCALATAIFAAPAPAAAGIVSHGISSANYSSESTQSLRLSAPAGAQAGDLLVASIGFGATSASVQPTLSAPAGWALVSRTDRGAVDSLAVYRHVFAAGESSYTWTTNVYVGGALFLAAFSGVDASNPVDASSGQVLLNTSSATTPSLTTAAPGELLLSSFYGHRNFATGGSWTPPSGMTEIGDVSNGGSRSGSIDYAIQASAGSTGAKTATAAAGQEYTIANLTALRAAAAPPPPAPGTIVPHGVSSVSYSSESTQSVRLSVPAGAQAGDLLIASIGFGATSASVQPTLSAPAGWTLVSRTDRASVDSLAVYRHVFAAGESSYTWTASVNVGGAMFLAAFSGVDPSNPIDTSAGQALLNTNSATTPSLTTARPGELLLASSYGHRNYATSGSWSPPSGMTEIGDVSNGGSRSGSIDYAIQASPGSTGAKTVTASATQDYTIANLTALRASAAPASGPVPVTIDTDIFSSVDDVGALAVAFALQLKNEAKVIAIGVDTRTDRPGVAPNSWKCAAAIAQFYKSPSVPIGSDLPANGSEVNSPDFVGPCANLVAPSTPSPDSAVNVYRRALAGQADGSVVMESTGYLENLSALLNSPADSISPLSGRDLIAKKVKMLVVMGGGYPNRPGENNLRGNPAAAQNVANNWPTKLVWSGYEVGDVVHTGQTISSVHPAASPVRVSYEAFVRPGNWYYSYDLTAVYHAIRPADPLLTEVGPGKNAVDSQGGNTFTSGPGNQYYLRLSDANALGSALENLLDTLP